MACCDPYMIWVGVHPRKIPCQQPGDLLSLLIGFWWWLWISTCLEGTLNTLETLDLSHHCHVKSSSMWLVHKRRLCHVASHFFSFKKKRIAFIEFFFVLIKGEISYHDISYITHRSHRIHPPTMSWLRLANESPAFLFTTLLWGKWRDQLRRCTWRGDRKHRWDL